MLESKNYEAMIINILKSKDTSAKYLWYLKMVKKTKGKRKPGTHQPVVFYQVKQRQVLVLDILTRIVWAQEPLHYISQMGGPLGFTNTAKKKKRPGEPISMKFQHKIQMAFLVYNIIYYPLVKFANSKWNDGGHMRHNYTLHNNINESIQTYKLIDRPLINLCWLSGLSV